jgi:hypothetical protein
MAVLPSSCHAEQRAPMRSTRTRMYVVVGGAAPARRLGFRTDRRPLRGQGECCMPLGSALRPRIDRWTTYGQQIGRAALRRFVRLLPAERQRVFALTLLLGGLCGLVAVAFHLAIQAAEVRLIDRALNAAGQTWIVWTILLPALGGLVSGIILAYVVPDARGSGIPQVKVAYAVNGGRLPFRVVIGKFCLGVIGVKSRYAKFWR